MISKFLSEVTLAFLDREDFDTQLDRVLQLLVTGLKLSRAYIFCEGSSRATMGAIREYCAEGIPAQWMRDIPYGWYAVWKRLLIAQGRILAANARTLPSDLASELTAHGIQALVAYPIETAHEMAGFIGFDDCRCQRLWTTEEIDLLRAAARLISVFHDRQRFYALLQAGSLSAVLPLPEETVHDPLTGLYTRRHVFELLKGFDAEYARHDRNFGVSVLDLDHFKAVNYHYGREAGDFVLKSFGAILAETLRPYDLCGRLGGEEFIIVSVNSSVTETVFMIERIMRIVRDHVFAYQGMNIRLRFSCGVACASEYAPENLSIHDLVERATRRMYSAKQEGRDRIVLPSVAA